MKRLIPFASFLLIAAAVISCLLQFRCDHLGPLAVSVLLLAVVWFIRPAWRRCCLAIPIAAALLLVGDALVLRHRIAVEFRAWAPIMDITSVEDVIHSPSGQTTVYIVGAHWLDSAYWAYISDGGLFPRHSVLHTRGDDAYYPRDITATWSGSTFTAAEQFVTLRYDESARTLESFTQ